MKDALLLGLGRHMIPVPRQVWHGEVAKDEQRGPERLAFMTEAHQQVRDFVVRELPRFGQPLSPETIAQNLDMPVAKVVPILEELEQRLTFLYRNKSGAVVWAYPVTVAQTPHRITLRTNSSHKSSEKLYAA